MSRIGQPLKAPNGYLGLSIARTYYFLGRSDDKESVTLCFFSSTPINVHIERVRTSDFEKGLLEQRIEHDGEPSNYPPWIAAFAGAEKPEDSVAMSLPQFLAKNRALVDTRYKQIQPLINKRDTLLSAKDPFDLTNEHARSCTPRQHPARIRLWVFSYFCFGMSDYSLLPDTWKNGRWDRDKTPPKRKYGRKNKRTGEFSGHSGNERFTEKCIQGYDRFKKEKTFKKMHEATLKEIFKCSSRRIDGQTEHYHPEGKPYPSYHQFMRRVYKKYGRSQVRKQRYGAARQRRKESASEGPFTEYCSNLMERVEADGYFVSTTLRGLDGGYAPPMCIVRIVDVTSGLRVGIGCSLNGEKSEAYKMALFCMGIPKEIFCSFFGIKISPLDWPSIGYPISCVLDRGPGTKAALWETLSTMVPHIEMTGSYAAQSKAGVESTNPRNTRKEGKPEYRVSHLNYFEYFRHEILQTIGENKRSNISGRSTLTLIDDHVKPRPIHLWNYLERRARNDAFSPDFETVARSFLECREFKITRAGVHLDFLRFRSEELRQTGICDRITGGASITVDGFILPMSIRQIWIVHEGRLIECSLVPALLGDESDLDYTVKDLERIIEIRKGLEAECREEDLAIALEIAEAFEDATGKSPYGGTAQAQRPRRKKPEAMDELAAVERIFARRRVSGS